MKPELTIHLTPESPRTTVPILVNVLGAKETVPQLTVSLRGEDLFRVELTVRDKGYYGMFWVNEPGDYLVTAQSGADRTVREMRVAEQTFLPFSVEFGIFSLALLLAGGGLIAWFRNRKKAGSTSPSSLS